MATVYETGKGWGVDYRDEWNRRHRFMVGSEAAARAVASQLEGEVDAKRQKLRLVEQRGNLSFLDTWNVWNSMRSASLKLKQVEAAWLASLLRLHGAKPCAEISPHLLRDWLEKTRAEKAPSTVYQTVMILRKFFAAAKELGYAAINPAFALGAPVPPPSSGRRLEPVELALLLEQANPFQTCKILLAADAGLRSGEIRLLRKSAVSLDEMTLTFFRPKSKIISIVPLTARLAAVLAPRCARIESPDGFLFSNAGRPTHSAVQFMRMLEARTGVVCRFHDLRHTFGSRAAATGCRNRVLQVLLGHAPATPSEKYDHPTLAELRDVIGKIQTEEKTP